MKPSIRRNLRMLRASCALTQRKAATRAAIPYWRYMAIENGDIEPTPRELAQIAKAVRATVDEITTDPPRPLSRTTHHGEANNQV